MLNIDLGGTKAFVQTAANWQIMDIVGSGSNVIRYDLNSGDQFPFSDDFVDNYYTSHTLEHVNLFHLSHVFNEIYRTLKPSGKFRIVIPDFEVGVQWYLKSPEKLFTKIAPGYPPYYPKTKLGRLLGWIMTDNNGHKNCLDFETLCWYLNNSKFRVIKRMKYNECSPVFAGKDMIRYQDYSIFCESEK
jgi:predicted SAM-dependent methyltransferase